MKFILKPVSFIFACKTSFSASHERNQQQNTSSGSEMLVTCVYKLLGLLKDTDPHLIGNSRETYTEGHQTLPQRRN